MNQFSVTGRLCNDPITSNRGEKKFTTFTLASRRRFVKEGGQEADFFRCICFNQSSDFAQNYLKKGMKVEVNGEVRVESYEQDEKKMTSVSVIIDKLEFAESKEVNEKYLVNQETIDDTLPFE